MSVINSLENIPLMINSFAFNFYTWFSRSESVINQLVKNI